MADPRFAEARAEREKEFDIGFKRGKELFPERSLQRVRKEPDLLEVQKRRRENLAGYSPQELESMRGQALQAINRGTQENLRTLRGIQGAAGVRGAQAGAQAANVLNQRTEQVAQTERALQLSSAQERRAALDALEATATGLGKFDIGQAEKEKSLQLQTALSEQMLGSVERAGVRAQDLARQQASVAGGGGKK